MRRQRRRWGVTMPNLKKPRRTKPPIRPRGSDRSVKHEVSAGQERFIGQAIAAWSRLEDTMQEAIWSFLNVGIEEGRIVTARLDARFKLNILRGLGAIHLSEKTAEQFKELLAEITDLYADRNFIAHGKWLTMLPDNLPAAASLRERDPTVPSTEITVETFPADRMREIIRSTITAMNSLIKIMNEHETSHGRLLPPHRQT
jgi:hypothetical protein